MLSLLYQFCLIERSRRRMVLQYLRKWTGIFYEIFMRLICSNFRPFFQNHSDHGTVPVPWELGLIARSANDAIIGQHYTEADGDVSTWQHWVYHVTPPTEQLSSGLVLTCFRILPVLLVSNLSSRGHYQLISSHGSKLWFSSPKNPRLRTRG